MVKRDKRYLDEYPFRLEHYNKKSITKKVKINANEGILDYSTGELRDITQMCTTQMFVDGTEFVKVYRMGAILRLSNHALRVFLYMLGILDFNGMIFFHISKCREFTGMSTAMISRAIKELKELEFVKKVSTVYYVNFNIAFRGNREKINEKSRIDSI